jgi:hypothetical protein
MKRYGLLIIDDEIHILRTLALTFKEDYRVFTATPVGLRPWGGPGAAGDCAHHRGPTDASDDGGRIPGEDH